MVRTYSLVPVFYEASGNLGLQPFARATTSNLDSPPCYVQPNSSPDHWLDRRAADQRVSISKVRKLRALSGFRIATARCVQSVKSMNALRGSDQGG